MNTTHRALLCMILLMAAPRASNAQTPITERCYKFRDAIFHAWNPSSRAGYDSSSVIRLIGWEKQDSGGVAPRHLQVSGADLHRYPLFSGWRRPKPDSIEIAWRNGFYGPVFNGFVRGDSIFGAIRFTTDEGMERPPTRSSAIRVPCEE